LTLFQPNLSAKCAKVERFQSIDFIPQAEASLCKHLRALRAQQRAYRQARQQTSVKRFAVLNIITAHLSPCITALSDQETLVNDTG